MDGRERGCRDVVGVAGLTLVVAVIGAGCGFLDDPPPLSERGGGMSMGSISGSGSGGGCGGVSRSFGCGVGSYERSSREPAVVPQRPRVRLGDLRQWYQSHCRGRRAPICRRLRVRLQGATVVAMLDDDDEDDEEANDDASSTREASGESRVASRDE